ncbi:MAG: hypothetical protein AABZ29_00085 [Gemmatimonadota bacterium]
MRRVGARVGPRVATLFAVACLTTTPTTALAYRTPSFARQYRTTCSTCHTAAPKLNMLGEAFRLNGYRLPDNGALIKREAGLPLGDDAWKELWPRAIWPGEIPVVPPISVRIQSDAVVRRGSERASAWMFRFPSEVSLLAATTLGEGVNAFLEAEWTPDRGLDVVQARVGFQDPLPFLPHRALNLWVGKQNPTLFTFADRKIDQMGRLAYYWQEFGMADLRLSDPERGRTLQSANASRLPDPQPAVEFNGLAGGRAYYSVAIAQVADDTSRDRSAPMRATYKLRYKWGGLRLDGLYDSGRGPRPNGGGQLLDRAVVLEHFGQLASASAPDGGNYAHRSFGVAVRLLNGPLDAGMGAVWRRDDDPWGTGVAADMTSVFGKAEYLVFPWLIGSLRAERFDAGSPAARRAGFTRGTDRRTRVAPGVVMLIRQNIRLVAEGELGAPARAPADGIRPRPVIFGMRLDVIF